MHDLFMFSKLPLELQNIILDYVFECKKRQNFYINKEIVNYVGKKNKKCKKNIVFGKELCVKCHANELGQLQWMFHYNLF
jgi:hypothetical protein